MAMGPATEAARHLSNANHHITRAVEELRKVTSENSEVFAAIRNILDALQQVQKTVGKDDE